MFELPTKEKFPQVRGQQMTNKLVQEAPYHPGYEDAVFENKINANQLADELENTMRHRNEIIFVEAATMLRQQQAEIEALKKEAALQRLSDFTQEVAKTLTDEEITDIAKEHIHQRLEGERFGYVDFARAILRKAQEK
jgi:hypothetical protein